MVAMERGESGLLMLPLLCCTASDIVVFN